MNLNTLSHFALAGIIALMGGCTALGLSKPDLATDCAAQSSLIHQAAQSAAYLYAAERAAIDTQITLSKGYCTGTLPADQTNASKAVEASNVQIASVLAVAAARPH